MERRFRTDFSQVRIHADAHAAELAGAASAKALTWGSDIYFGQGQPGSDPDRARQLLAHELAHVIQQSRGGSLSDPDRSGAHEQDARAAAGAIQVGSANVTIRTGAAVSPARVDGSEPPPPPYPVDLVAEIHAEEGVLHDLRIEAEALIEHVLGQTHPSRVWVGRPSGSSKPPSVPEHGAVSLGWIEARLEELARGSGSAAEKARRALNGIRVIRSRLADLNGQVRSRVPGAQGRAEYTAGEAGAGADTSAPEAETHVIKHRAPSSGSEERPRLTAEETGTPQLAAGEPLTVEAPGTETAPAIEAEEAAGHGASVGGRFFTMISWGGMLYAVANIRTFGDAVRVSELIGLSFGAARFAEAFAESAGIAAVIPVVLGMENDQGPGYQERQRKSMLIEQFLHRNFTESEIEKDGPRLREQAQKLLFKTEPLVIPQSGAGTGSMTS